jgi:hypothetical protein
VAEIMSETEINKPANPASVGDAKNIMIDDADSTAGQSENPPSQEKVQTPKPNATRGAKGGDAQLGAKKKQKATTARSQKSARSAKPLQTKTKTKKKSNKSKAKSEATESSSDKLSPEEKQLRRVCETTIRKGKKWFVPTGRALAVINERRLYREGYPTFDAYCKQRWGFTDAHAHRLIEAFKVAEDLSPFGDELLPDNEAQTRVLAKVPAANRLAVMMAAKELAGKERFTKTHIKKAIKEVLGTKETDEVASDQPENPVVPKPQNIAPISVEQILLWVETVQEHLKAEANYEECIELMDDIAMGLKFIINQPEGAQAA